MTIVEEIEDVAEGMTEAPKKKGPTKFSSGHDWYDSLQHRTQADLIKCAIAGCIGAKYTLTGEPYNFKEVSIGGKVVTTKGEGWYI